MNRHALLTSGEIEHSFIVYILNHFLFNNLLIIYFILTCLYVSLLISVLVLLPERYMQHFRGPWALH